MLDAVLQSFNFKVLQSVGQVRRILDENSISWNEFDKWLEDRLRNDLPRSMIKRLCPKCNELLSLVDVNTREDNKVEGEWLSMWFCDECGWNELSKVPRQFESHKYLVKITKEEAEELKAKYSRPALKG